MGVSLDLVFAEVDSPDPGPLIAGNTVYPLVLPDLLAYGLKVFLIFPLINLTRPFPVLVRYDLTAYKKDSTDISDLQFFYLSSGTWDGFPGAI
jgi:hypothetical protein